LLPYIEQNTVYSLWNIHYRVARQPPPAYQTYIQTFHCPARVKPVLSIGDFATPGGIGGDYAACIGTNPDYIDSNGAMIPNIPFVTTDRSGEPYLERWIGQVRWGSITDGTSSTLLMGEKHIRPLSYRGRNEDRSIYSAVRNTHRRSIGIHPNGNIRRILPPQDETTALANSSFGSHHPQICQFSFCDGSIRVLRINTDLNVLTALATRAGGEAVNLDF
jgi:hypothetical protein